MGYQIILAPMQGYTDAVFRDVYFRHFTGVDEAMSPFVSTMSQKKINRSQLKDILPENNLNCPNIIPQMLGNVAQDFLSLACHISEIGYETINLNMGCPHSKVAKKRRGSGLLSYPDVVDKLLYDLFDGLSKEPFKCKISIKVRLGRYNKDEIFELIPIFEKYPLDEIILHPRTGVDMYEGRADIDAFIKVAKSTSHKLVYNGDITSLAVFKNITDRLEAESIEPIRRFMVGRGILSDPFLPEEIKAHFSNSSSTLTKNIASREEKLKRLKSFHDDLFEAYSQKFYGPLHVTGRMKGFWTYIGPTFFENKKGLKKILKAKNRDHYKDVVDSFFDEVLSLFTSTSKEEI
ncbi:MAG: tRNA-dihydrouridine synthase family protein [Desulfamplus sp.]|nr:tRNA-dihydrouridine synthase family protein [Desulfamplus sp.]